MIRALWMTGLALYLLLRKAFVGGEDAPFLEPDADGEADWSLAAVRAHVESQPSEASADDPEAVSPLTPTVNR